jgi:hypothetical protein
MIPKEKAEELVDKYLNASFNCKDCDMPYCDIRCTQLMKSEAKVCALIAVDEIISLVGRYSNYWQEVKQEIENFKSIA